MQPRNAENERTQKGRLENQHRKVRTANYREAPWEEWEDLVVWLDFHSAMWPCREWAAPCPQGRCEPFELGFWKAWQGNAPEGTAAPSPTQ